MYCLQCSQARGAELITELPVVAKPIGDPGTACVERYPPSNRDRTSHSRSVRKAARRISGRERTASSESRRAATEASLSIFKRRACFS